MIIHVNGEPEEIDIDFGADHYGRFFQWAPDRELNPHYSHLPDIPKAGILIYHKIPGTDEFCIGGCNFDIPHMREIFASDKSFWKVEKWEPLTLSPSVHCLLCNDHGFIREGAWVKA